MKEYIKEYYKMGLYNESDLDMFVEAEMITLEEKEEIMKA